MPSLKYHIWYNFRIAKCFKTTWQFMVVVPWYLLFITKFFLLWVELWPTFSCYSLWHKMHLILWNLQSPKIVIKSLSLKNTHIFIKFCHVIQAFGWFLVKWTIVLTAFSFKNLQIIFIDISINSYLNMICLKSTTTTPNPLGFTNANTIISYIKKKSLPIFYHSID
jgi:hypothetical protein